MQIKWFLWIFLSLIDVNMNVKKLITMYKLYIINSLILNIEVLPIIIYNTHHNSLYHNYR